MFIISKEEWKIKEEKLKILTKIQRYIGKK